MPKRSETEGLEYGVSNGLVSQCTLLHLHIPGMDPQRILKNTVELTHHHVAICLLFSTKCSCRSGQKVLILGIWYSPKGLPVQW